MGALSYLRNENFLTSLLFFAIEVILLSILVPYVTNRKLEHKWAATRRLAAQRAVRAVEDVLCAIVDLNRTLQFLVPIKEGDNVIATLGATIEHTKDGLGAIAARYTAMAANQPLPALPTDAPRLPRPRVTEKDRARLKTLEVRVPIEMLLQAVRRFQSTLEVFTPALTPDLIVAFAAMYDHLASAEPAYQALQVLFVDESPSIDHKTTALSAGLDPEPLLKQLKQICDLAGVHAEDRKTRCSAPDLRSQTSLAERFVKEYFDWPPPVSNDPFDPSFLADLGSR